MNALSPGKAWGLRRLADDGGRFAMLAVDQRPPIMDLVRKVRGTAEAPFDDVATVKRLLTRHLAPEASAVLVDPVWGYDRCISHVSPRQGLILTLEDHAYRDTPEGRLSGSIAGWSADRIRRQGADAVKILAWYRPDTPASTRRHQEEWVANVGRDCRAADIALVFELLVYPRKLGGAPDYADDPERRPELVIDSVRTFADARFGVDLFKLESPLPAASLPDPARASAAEVRVTQAWFDRLGQATAGRPWVMLSAGAQPEAFQRVLHYAYAAGASGYLAGRAIWWRAFQHFPDLAAFSQGLETDGVRYMHQLNALTRSAARPWAQNP